MDDQYRDVDIMIPVPKAVVSMKSLVKNKTEMTNSIPYK